MDTLSCNIEYKVAKNQKCYQKTIGFFGTQILNYIDFPCT